MKIYETLARIWLPEQAVKIYLSLLEYGQGNVTDIARSTELHRAIVYRYLPLLEERRLISKFVSGKRTLYRANDPKHLKEMLSSLESRLDIVIETLQEKQKIDWEGMFEYGKWVEAIRYVHESGIDESPIDGTIRRYSSRKREFKWLIMTPEYKEKRKKKRIYYYQEYSRWHSCHCWLWDIGDICYQEPTICPVGTKDFWPLIR